LWISLREETTTTSAVPGHDPNLTVTESILWALEVLLTIRTEEASK
jgi:hypothetical protein